MRYVNFLTLAKIGMFSSCISNSIFAMSPAQKADLVDVEKVNPRIEIEVVYATNKNFTGQVIYESPKCYLRKEVAQALNKAQQRLENMKSQKHPNGLRFKAWDGYRPMGAQQKLWDVCAKQYPDEKERENYVSNPKKGGRHTRGTAIDLTLVDIATGKELPMPTEFDDFTKKAWRDYEDLPEEIKQNRKLLEDVMREHGFAGLKSEWWHFDYEGWELCEPLNIPLSVLAKN